MIEFERAKELAKIRKLSLREVNDKAGLGKNSIYKWKTNKPGSDALAAVAKALTTSTDYLKGLTDDPHIHSDESKSVSIDDEDVPYSYQGRPVPKRYLDMVRGLMDQDMKESSDKDGKSK